MARGTMAAEAQRDAMQPRRRIRSFMVAVQIDSTVVRVWSGEQGE
jgi:hypothetical protein